jgi:hypothetical protein
VEVVGIAGTTRGVVTSFVTDGVGRKNNGSQMFEDDGDGVTAILMPSPFWELMTGVVTTVAPDGAGVGRPPPPP